VDRVRSVAPDERVRNNGDRQDGNHLDRGGEERRCTKLSHAGDLGMSRASVGFGFLEVDPAVLVPLAAVLKAQHAAQAWPLGCDHRADPEAVVPVPLRRVL
jgi:hypothetical protein